MASATLPAHCRYRAVRALKMIVSAFHPSEFAPPGGAPRPLTEEQSANLFRAIVAASTIANISDGFVGIQVHRPKADGPILYQWQFADDSDERTAQAHVQIMLDKAVRPLFEGGRWRPSWV